MYKGRGALDLISTYNNEDTDEDDIVPGPKVSTKRLHKSSSDEEETNKKTLINKLPIPDIFKQSKSIEGNQDNPEEHDGRLRSFPHERGNWATFAYILYENNYSLEALINEVLEKFPELELKLISEFHVSLTKTVTLKYHWIDSFISTLKGQLKEIQRFVIMLDTFKVYCNEERTRTFIGLQIKSGYNSLLNITTVLNQCLKEYNLESFYKDPSFHISIFWCLGDKEKEIQEKLASLNDLLFSAYENGDQSDWYIYVNAINCKIGNKNVKFCLK